MSEGNTNSRGKQGALRGLKAQEKDPLILQAAIALLFFGLALLFLGYPADRFSEEPHYVRPAARLLLGWNLENPEHPMLGKSLIAASMKIFGNSFVGLRLGSLIAGVIGLFAMSRALWWYSMSGATAILFSLLLGTNFIWFVMSSAAILDPYMFGFLGGALLFFVRAAGERRWNRNYLVLTGLCLGLALGVKWMVAPVCLSIALTYAWLNRKSFGALFAGGIYLGVVPFAVYFLTFLPGFFVRNGPLTLDCLLPLQLEMLKHMNHYDRVHPYGAQWWQWVLNIRPFWGYFTENAGAFRAVVIAGNPVTTILGAVAVLVGVYRWVRHGDWRLGVPSAYYVFFLGFFALSSRGTQYFYYYLLPFAFALAVLSIFLARLWERAIRWPALVSVGLSACFFAWFYPVLTGAPLSGETALARYEWPFGWEVKPDAPIQSNTQKRALGTSVGEICERISASRASAGPTAQ